MQLRSRRKLTRHGRLRTACTGLFGYGLVFLDQVDQPLRQCRVVLVEVMAAR